ncbi:MAG: DUF4350 domain-containing protein [Pseudomonadota bacterium]
MRSQIAGAAVALAIAALVAWFLSTHERETREAYVGFSGEARYNKFLAAEKLLQGFEVDADSRDSFKPSNWLPPGSDTLVVYANPGLAEENEFDVLFDWVSVQGGHLVLLPPDEINIDVELFLASFDVTLERLEEVDPETGANVEDDDEIVEENEETYEYTVNLSSTQYRIRAEPGDQMATLEDDKGYIAVRFPEGNGYVTVLASDQYFSNHTLQHLDHARLLLDVVAGYVAPGKVWFVLSATFPPLWKLIVEAAPYLLLTLALMLAFWLWSLIPRFGPAVEALPESRRSIAEHILAAGRFTWRHDGAVALADNAIRATLHDAERKHPGIGRLPASKQAETLDHLTGLDAGRIFDALVSAEGQSAREFTESIQLLQTIRKKL